jgi:hypothetical protein
MKIMVSEMMARLTKVMVMFVSHGAVLSRAETQTSTTRVAHVTVIVVVDFIVSKCVKLNVQNEVFLGRYKLKGHCTIHF